MEKKILIIGGKGYIGNKLYDYLNQYGIGFTNNNYIVNSLDLEWYGNSNFLHDSLKIDFNNCNKGYLSCFDVIILLAGHSSVKMCEESPSGCFNNNVKNFFNLIQKLNKNQKFIYASSSSVYNSLNSELKDENCTQYFPTNYYDLSKHEIDSYMKIYGELNDIEYYGLRFGTVNGFSPNTRTDVMINAMYNNAKDKKGVFINNIGINRPILGINDLCKAIHYIIEKGEFSKRGIYNLSSFNASVLEIGETVSDLLNVNLNISHVNSKCYDFQISSKKFMNNFGFVFKDDIKSITNSFINNKKEYLKSNRNNKIDYV